MQVASPHVLARLLRERLAANGDPSRAVTLARLLDVYLSYAVVRRSLGLAGKGEYDVAILGLLVDRTLLQVDPAVEAAARRELEGPEPDLAFSAALSDRLVRLRPGADGASVLEGLIDPGRESPEDEPARVVEAESEEASSPEPEAAEPAATTAVETAETELRAAPTVAEPAPPEPDETPAAPEPPVEEPSEPPVAAPECCWSCAAELPDRDGVRFCPHCGSDQVQPRCTACGERVEAAWAFCPRCGRALGT